MESRPPFFSIIIPTCSRPRQLANCLESIAGLDYPGDGFEVIVVDDGSKMTLDNITNAFRNRLNITLLTQSHGGPAMARNRGAAQAKGEHLAFTDDDCRPSRDWLHALAARFAMAPQHAVGGRTINVLRRNQYATASQFLIDYFYSCYNADSNGAHFLASNNLAVPTDRFRALDGFDVTFPLAAAEDREFCDRWLGRGYPMIYAPEVLVYHAHNLTLAGFWWQHFNYGRGAFHFHLARARRGAGRIKLEHRSFYLKLVSYPFVVARNRHSLLLCALLGLSQLATAAGFYREKLRLRQPGDNVIPSQARTD